MNYLKVKCLFNVNVTMLMIKVNVYLFIMLCYVIIQDIGVILGGCVVLIEVNNYGK